MKYKKGFKFKVLSALMLMCLMLIAIAPAYAVVPFECNTTKTASTLGDNAIINITWGGTTPTTLEAINFTFILTSPSTANSTAATGTISNGTRNHSIGMANLSIATYGIVKLEDSHDYTLAATAYNGTTNADAVSCATKPVTIDRAKPTTPTSVSPTGKQTTSNDATFSATVNGANTTGCTLEFSGKNTGSASYAMTHSGDSCTLTINDIARGIYPYAIRATDGTNTSLSTEVTDFEVHLPSETTRKGAIASAIASGKIEQKAGGLQIASGTPAGLNSKGLQNAIAKTNSNLKQEMTKTELKKTGTGAAVGAAVGAGVGAIGFIIPPLGFITVPAGAGIGAIIGGAIGYNK